MARYFGHSHSVADDAEVVDVNPVAQIVRVIASAVMALLALRLVLRAFGASTSSAFVNFVYDVTYPLVAPFFGMFNTTVSYDFGTLEIETIVAMLVYSLVAYLILALARSFTPRA